VAEELGSNPAVEDRFVNIPALISQRLAVKLDSVAGLGLVKKTAAAAPPLVRPSVRLVNRHAFIARFQSRFWNAVAYRSENEAAIAGKIRLR